MKNSLKPFIFALTLFLFTSCNEQQKEATKEIEVIQQELNSKILESTKIIFRAWNEHNPNLVELAMTENSKHFSNGVETESNREGYIKVMETFITAMPDIKFTYDLDALRNIVYAKWTLTGTNQGKFLDQPPTNKTTVVHGLVKITFNQEGKVTLMESYFDQLSYLTVWGHKVSPPEIE